MSAFPDGMDLIDRIREVSNQVRKRASTVKTEEAAKVSLVMPFIHHVLGYDIFDPHEVVPEFTADAGIKKGEKADYAIMRDGDPIILFECKRPGADLSAAAPQLLRYFHVTPVRFGVLTDGAKYLFFSDLSKQNVMDDKPFLEIDMLDFSEADAAELRRFTKTSFDLDRILSTARDLKYAREIKLLLAAEWAEPSESFVRYITSQVYQGSRVKSVLEQFKGITRDAMKQFLSERIAERIKSVLDADGTEGDEISSAPETTDVSPGPPNISGIVTTDEEWRAFYIVKGIASRAVDPERIVMRDMRNYCNVVLDGAPGKIICRFWFNSPAKHIGLADGETIEKVPVASVDDLFLHADRIIAAIERIDASSA